MVTVTVLLQGFFCMQMNNMFIELYAIKLGHIPLCVVVWLIIIITNTTRTDPIHFKVGHHYSCCDFRKVLEVVQYRGNKINVRFTPCRTPLLQETPQCDKTRFSTIQPSIDMTG